MSGLPMSADTGHAFSVPKDSERGGVDTSRRESGGGTDGNPVLPARSEQVSYYSAWSLSYNRYAVVATPFNGLFEAEFPTVESAESHALALNEWLAARPSPDLVAPFFNPEQAVMVAPFADDAAAQLLSVLDAMLTPEMREIG